MLLSERTCGGLLLPSSDPCCDVHVVYPEHIKRQSDNSCRTEKEVNGTERFEKCELPQRFECRFACCGYAGIRREEPAPVSGGR